MRPPTTTALLSALVLTATLLFAVPAAAAAQPAGQTVDLIVAFEDAPPPGNVDALVDTAAIVAEQTFDDTLHAISVAAADAPDVVAELRADPRVSYVEPNAQAHIVATPGDPLYSQQWGVPLTRVPTVWDVTTGSGDVVIAVIDTGVNAAHPDLAGVSFVAGHDFVNGDTTPEDDNGHGTAAVGVISSQHNSIGTAGVCPRCQIMPLKSMDAQGTGSHLAIASAIHHAVDNGADIINLSLGSEASTTTLETAVRRAHDAGILVVAAAGNSGVTTPFYPAGYPEALGVAASDVGDGRYSWSNYGSWVGVSAPGCNVTAGYAPATDTLGYTNFCGTSSAAPYAAAVAGLLASARPGVGGSALTTALQSSAVPLSFVSSGRIDAAAALAALPLPELDLGGGGGGGGGALPPADDTEPADELPEPEVPAETTTSVTPSASSIPYGSAVEIAGRVSTTAGSAEGAMVTLDSRRAGQPDWTELAEQPADDAGGVVFTRRPQHNAEYRLRFDGSAAQAASVSDPATVGVRPVVSAATPRPRVLAGRKAVVTGAVEPAKRGMEVMLQRRTPKGWREVAVGTTRSEGGFRLTAPARVGRSYFRVHVPATTELGSATSTRMRVLGERVKIVRVRADARGDDGRNLNGELMVLRNTGKTPIKLRGWTVRSASTKTTFALPGYRLPAGARVKIHSGNGRSRKGHVYLDAGTEVWRNRFDTGVVRHPTGPVAARVRW